MMTYNFNKYQDVVPKLGAGDDGWISYFERLVDDMYADGLKRKGVIFTLHRYTFWTPDINMRSSLDMLTGISRYIHGFKFTGCIIEEGETFTA